MNLEFSDLRLALHDFEIAYTGAFTQRVTVLFGASGAGKTSLLEVIAGLRRPQHGHLRLGETVLIDVAAGVFVPPQDLLHQSYHHHHYLFHRHKLR